MDPELERLIQEINSQLDAGRSREEVNEALADVTGFRSIEEVLQAAENQQSGVLDTIRRGVGSAAETLPIPGSRGLAELLLTDEEQRASRTLATQGLTFNFADEIQGLLAGAIPGGLSREEARTQARQRADASEQVLGDAAFVPEFTGATAPTLIPLGGGIGAFNLLGRLRNFNTFGRAAAEVAKIAGLSGLGAAEAVAFSLGADDIPIEEKFKIEAIQSRGGEAILGAVLAGGPALLLRPFLRRGAAKIAQRRGPRSGREFADELLETSERTARRADEGPLPELTGERPVGAAEADEAVARSVQRGGPDIQSGLERLQKTVRSRLRVIGVPRNTVSKNLRQVRESFDLSTMERVGKVIGDGDVVTGEALHKVEKILEEAAGDTPERLIAAARFRDLNTRALGEVGDQYRAATIATREAEDLLPTLVDRGRADFTKSADKIRDTLGKMGAKEGAAYRMGLMSKLYDDVASVGEITPDTFRKIQAAGLEPRIDMIFQSRGSRRLARNTRKLLRQGEKVAIAKEELASQGEFLKTIAKIITGYALNEVLRDAPVEVVVDAVRGGE